MDLTAQKEREHDEWWGLLYYITLLLGAESYLIKTSMKMVSNSETLN